MDLLNNRQSKTIVDIDHCLALQRVDEQIYYYFHIFPTIDVDLRAKFKMDNTLKYLTKIINDSSIRAKIEFFYKISTSEAGYILFADTWRDVDLYDLDSNIYKIDTKKTVFVLINDIKMLIFTELGNVKNELMSSKLRLEDTF